MTLDLEEIQRMAETCDAYGHVVNAATVLALVAEVRRLREDAARLDYLDERNDRKNRQNGTVYGWGLVENHNRIALEDHHWPALNVRVAIDDAREKNNNP